MVPTTRVCPWVPPDLIFVSTTERWTRLRGTGVPPSGDPENRGPSSGDPEAGVLPGVWRNSIPEYFFPNSLPLIARFRHRTRGITCALKSTGVAHSKQASLRQDIAPVILRFRVPLRPEPHSEPGGGPVPFPQTGSGAI
ncbi:hypothetical protein F2Q70_00016941 [Brassica cretica]|uniref:Uncharacterized protein n=1 Tax=Brassica cretica TaxID=69181 RepID=A0A8S9HT27_BRACR|nr:hypothetical protein F2Q70_00016941 [Brassica cretica]KAF2599448.1 hypothetical protein F2Q68_00009905 [Brassica cretica]